MARVIKKPWRGNDKYLGYRSIMPERHLIVTEGKKTEPLYFEGLKGALKEDFRRQIQIVIKGTGKHTLNLLSYAITENRNAGGYDHVWVVYDRDDFNEGDFDRVWKQCGSLSNSNVSFHALWSNPCIETWFLLHFGFSTAYLNSYEAQERLRYNFKQLLHRDYVKNDEEVFNSLLGLLWDADQNAYRLEKWHEAQGNLWPSQMNPGTAMPLIVRQLWDYMW